MERILSPMRTQLCHDTQHIIQNRSIPTDHSALSSACSKEISGCPDIQSSIFSPLGNDAEGICRQARRPAQRPEKMDTGSGQDAESDVGKVFQIELG